MRRFLPLVFFGFLFTSYNSFSQSVVISEVYGGGGNSGATYKNDFIELYNPTNSTVTLTGWSVQYATSSGSSWQVTNLSGSIAAHSYYLIQEAVGSGGTVNLPTPDATGTINMSATAGKVALVSSTTALATATPASTSYIDLVGFGTAAFYEGSGPAAGASNTLSVERKANASSTSTSMKSGGVDEFLGNGYDTNNNNVDFVTRSPQPQNSISGVEPDITAPAFISSYPKIINLTDVEFDLVVDLNEVGKVYFVVLADGATAPLSAQVKTGQDAGGNAVANSGFISITASASEFTKTISGLSSSTSYDLYVVAEDHSGNLQSDPILLDVATNVSTAPSISPSVSSITFTGFTDKSKQSTTQTYTISASNLTDDVSITVSGFFLISTDDVNFGTALTILAANFSSPQTVYVKFNPSGNIGMQTGTITQSTTAADSKDVTLSAVGIDPYNQNFNDVSFLSNSGWAQYSELGAQVWASTNFGHTCLSGCNTSTADKAAEMNGYSGGSLNNEDWLLSPLLDLTTFVNYPSLSFWTISAFAGDQLQLKYSSDYTGSGDPALATWTTIDGKFPASNSSVWTNSMNIILPKSKIYVAFIYTSNTATASRWTVDDWLVTDVSSFINVSNINFSFNEVLPGASSASQNFMFTSQGYGDITITAPDGYEVSTDNSVFAENTIVAEADAAYGETIYVRFSPISKQLKWNGALLFTGNGLNSTYGSLIGSSFPKSETFNVATYNMEFFASNVKDNNGAEFGPTDDALQLSNVTTVMQTIGADIFAVEEISNDSAFAQLANNLSGYDKIEADRWSYSWQAPDPHYPPQKTGFIYNTSRVNLVSSRVMFAAQYDSILAGTKILPDYPTGTSSSFWSSGRLPFMATFDVTVDGVTRRIRMIDIHAKSGSDQDSYNRRVYDANVLLDSLNKYYKNDNIILLGDFNDDVYGSITTGVQSSYQSFVDDASDFNLITYALNQSGASTFPNSASFLDNIIISNRFTNAYVSNSITIEDPRLYINNYLSATSDHLPVSARFLLSAIKADQTITFNELDSKTYGDANFTLHASASSGLAISYSSSDSTIASISGNTLTILKAGTVSVTASQSGSADYNAAVDVVQSLTINKADQAITFDELDSKTYGDANFTLHASASSGLAISYSSSDSTIASISGNTLTILNAGTVSVTASQSGSSDYNAAIDVVQSLTINKADQTITFNKLDSKTYGDANFTLNASASSGLTVSYSSSDPTIASISENMLTILKAGTVNITASQSGSADYNAAIDVVQSLTIKKVNQTISFSALSEKTLGDSPFNLSATATSSLSVSFSSTSDKVTINGMQVTLMKPGRTSITASQAGDANYNAAASVEKSFCIDPPKPIVTITIPSPTLTSSSSSGNQWYLNGSIITGATGSTVSVTQAGTYTVQVHADDCMSQYSNNLVIDITDIISQEKNTVSIYPNPAEDYLFIDGVSEIKEAQLYDVTGRVISLSLEKYGDVYRAYVGELRASLYLLRINKDGAITTFKFLKN